MVNALIAGLGVILSSIFGSALALIFSKIPHKVNDMFLGFAAGIMLAAAFLGLLPNAFIISDPANKFALSNIINILIAVSGVFIGGTLISLIDKLVPHIHFHDGKFTEEGGNDKKHHSKVFLLCIAIAIHNIPEGLATGISFSNGLSNGILVAISMMLQKIPEGLIVALPLISLGIKKGKVFSISILIALMMVPGLLLGIFFGTLPVLINGFFNAFTFGAIVYVISDEIIPESHENGFQKSATFSLLVGILSVVVIQLLLG